MLDQYWNSYWNYLHSGDVRLVISLWVHRTDNYPNLSYYVAFRKAVYVCVTAGS